MLGLDLGGDNAATRVYHTCWRRGSRVVAHDTRATGGNASDRVSITSAERASVVPDKADFGLSEWHEAIRGGERVLIRRMRPEDMALYPGFLGDVSAEDLRLRFFARVAELSAAELDKLTHLDYRHEMAFIALDEDTGHIFGLARLKDELDEKTAEFAILVRSRLKGHGLGWVLMRRIIDYAKEKGLRRVYGDVLVENTTMLQMCAELGFHEEDMGSEIRRVVLDLENTGQ
jgi:acetyltransferase